MIPFFNRSSREYLGSDIYQDSQQLTDRKDDYEGFQEDLQPETYRDKKRMLYNCTSFFKQIFPYLSGITLLFLVVFLSFNIDQVLRDGLSLKAAIIGGISLIMCVALIGLNELVKTRSLSDYFKDKSKQIRPNGNLLFQAVATACISIVGSSLGIYLLVYQINDNSQQIELEAGKQIVGTSQSWRADSIRISNLYIPSIQQKRESINRYNPSKYRTLRDRLNNEAIALSSKMQAELKQAKADRLAKESEISAKKLSELQQNELDAGGNAWIACVFILLGEVLNIICHRFCWIYKARSAREGIEFGAIEAKEEKTAYEIQLQRLGAFLQSQHQVGSLQIAGSKQDLKKPDQAGKIGFPTNDKVKESAKSDQSELLSEFAKIFEKFDKRLLDIEARKSVNKSGGRNTNLHTHQTEIALDNSHPKFTSKIQPTTYRGIDEKKYAKFLKVAKQVVEKTGKYNKSEIAKRIGASRPTAAKYLKAAIERKDLEA